MDPEVMGPLRTAEMLQETEELNVFAPRGVGQPVGLAEPFVWERGAGDPHCCSKWVLLIWQLLKSCSFPFSPLGSF